MTTSTTETLAGSATTAGTFTDRAFNLFDRYPPYSHAYDEFYSSPGQLRPHVHNFVRQLEQLGQPELSRRRIQAQRLIYENSVTYSSPQGDSEHRNRPWEYDVMPVLLANEDWQQLTTGLCQRARLLNLVLGDIYGQQDLIRRHVIPPELVFANSGFARPFHGLPRPHNLSLHLYAADVVRQTDGHWSVLADRSETPSGVAYALENRLVSASVFPDLFKGQRVQRLQPFFQSLRELLHQLAPQHRENPRVALLSQGSTNPNYFEDAYLSRYLGYLLVEGEDLAVRNERVQLKTLGGLLPIDVILRRLDDLDCDPLELRADSTCGVSGLVQAARSRSVVLANSLGTGVVEAPAFLPFLPRLCRELLGEDLKLPSITTYWCGDPESRKYVLDHLEGFLFRRALMRDEHEPLEPERMSRRQREQLLDSIRQHPADWVAQLPIGRSQAPVWLAEAVEPWRMSLRTYLVATGTTDIHGSSYKPLPGGLARVSPIGSRLDVSISRGEASKDVWVQSEVAFHEPAMPVHGGMMLELRRSGAELPSRVADNLFWLGRHAERAESAARLHRTLLSRMTSEQGANNPRELKVLLRPLAEAGSIEPGMIVDELQSQLPSLERLLPRAIFDELEPTSLRSALNAMNRTASLVRERLSIDSWRIINRIYHEFYPPRAGMSVDLAELQQQLNRLMNDLSAFGGLLAENMTRTMGWRLLEIGRRLERSLATINLARSLLAQEQQPDSSALEAVLEVADCQITYRTRYLSTVQLAPVLDLLITDDTNPRSLHYQLQRLDEHVAALPRGEAAPLSTPERRLTMTLLHSVRILTHENLQTAWTRSDRSTSRRALGKTLNRIAHQLPQLSDSLTHKYLVHALKNTQLTETAVKRANASLPSSRPPVDG